MTGSLSHAGNFRKAGSTRSRGAGSGLNDMDSIGVLLTSWPGHLPVLEKTLACLKDCPFPIVMGWDDIHLPVILGYVDKVFSVTPRKYAEGRDRLRKHWGEKAELMEGTRRIRALGYEYIFKVNGDQTFENLDRLPELTESLGDDDMVTFWDKEPIPEHLPVISFMAKTVPFFKTLKVHKFKDSGPKRLIESSMYEASKKTGLSFRFGYEFWTDVLHWANDLRGKAQGYGVPTE